MKKGLRNNVILIMVLILLLACSKDKINDNSQPVIEGEPQMAAEKDKSNNNDIVKEQKHETEEKDVKTNEFSKTDKLVTDELVKIEVL